MLFLDTLARDPLVWFIVVGSVWAWFVSGKQRRPVGGTGKAKGAP